MARNRIEKVSQELLDKITPEDIGERLYYMVQRMYYDANRTSDKDHDIDKSSLPDWFYREVQEMFFEKAYEKIIDVLTRKV